MKFLRGRVDLDAILPEAAAAASPLTALWTFPSMIAAAFLVSWGAEAAEFLVSQGLALAILALVQTFPELAVEAVIACKAGTNPPMGPWPGLGWPMIYGVAAFYSIKKRKCRLGSIRLHDEHAVEVLGLLPPLLYFVVIWAKGNLSLVDSAVLAATYVAYLWVLLRMPPRTESVEEDSEIPTVSRWALSFTGWKRWTAVGSLLLGGGVII